MFPCNIVAYRLLFPLFLFSKVSQSIEIPRESRDKGVFSPVHTQFRNITANLHMLEYTSL